MKYFEHLSLQLLSLPCLQDTEKSIFLTYMLSFQQTWIAVILLLRFQTQGYIHYYPKRSIYGNRIIWSNYLQNSIGDASDSSSEMKVQTAEIENNTEQFESQRRDPKVKKESLLLQLLNLLKPGEGQLQQVGRGQDARRKFSDPQMWTHIFFFISGFTALRCELYDLFILTLTTTPLSLAYHYSYERPGRLAQTEGLAAKSLFLYGLIQIFRAPSMSLAFLEFMLLFLTVVIFVSTNLKPKLYEPYHCFMHVIPPLWITVVAATHSPLIKIF